MNYLFFFIGSFFGGLVTDEGIISSHRWKGLWVIALANFVVMMVAARIQLHHWGLIIPVVSTAFVIALGAAVRKFDPAPDNN